jgi:hypothetical protein
MGINGIAGEAHNRRILDDTAVFFLLPLDFIFARTDSQFLELAWQILRSAKLISIFFYRHPPRRPG